MGILCYVIVLKIDELGLIWKNIKCMDFCFLFLFFILKWILRIMKGFGSLKYLSKNNY